MNRSKYDVYLALILTFFLGTLIGIYVGSCYIKIDCPNRVVKVVDISKLVTLPHFNSSEAVAVIMDSVDSATAEFKRRWEKIVSIGSANLHRLQLPSPNDHNSSLDSTISSTAAAIITKTTNGVVVTEDVDHYYDDEKATLDPTAYEKWIWHSRHPSKYGSISVYQMRYPDQPLRAFRGETIAETSTVGEILNAFMNASLTLSWASDLKFMETLPVTTNSNLEVSSSSSSGGGGGGAAVRNLPMLLQKSLRRLLSRKNHTSLATTSGVEGHLLQAPAEKSDVDYIAKSFLALDKHSVEDLVYQIYHKWPLKTRDFLFSRHFQVYEKNHTVIVTYKSTEDARRPVKTKQMIRTISPYTIWTFQSMQDYCYDRELEVYNHMRKKALAIAPIKERKFYQQGSSTTDSHAKAVDEKSKHVSYKCWSMEPAAWNTKTFIRLESYVLLEDLGFPWLINYIQSQWPIHTLRTFLQRVHEKQIPSHPRFQSWTDHR